MNKPTFKIISKDGKARAGEIKTDHGIVLTPAFLPVGTKATVKSLTPQQLKEIGIEAVLANTYHLHLQPGEDTIGKLGGLHKFMNWNKPLMTDSGGFQVFSLGVGLEKPGVKFLKDLDYGRLKIENRTLKVEDRRSNHHPSSIINNLSSTVNPLSSNEESRPRLNRITEEGVEFQSHIDGSKHKLTPELSVEIQEKIGADLIIAFDDLESPTYSFEQTKKSLELTNRWELRSLKTHLAFQGVALEPQRQLLYGVTHGGQFESLRRESARFVDKHFDAVALGGAHRNKSNMYQVIEWTVEELDEEKPRHMLGIGEVDDIFEVIERGVDTFDCVIPTRLGRMGHVFIYPPEGNIKNRFRYDITKSKYAKDQRPIAKDCDCYVCQNFTQAYINHLFRSRELLAYTLATYHNVYFINDLTNKIRQAILNKKFIELKKKWLL
ncbi:MAG: tRNA guanosine(34) transglycosylase Tgt [Candidatus Levybacteria bacterium]|nr:tRNA guanosine(34) transglycosylase Tgt [Candidatus Levybacteria bacterium]